MSDTNQLKELIDSFVAYRNVLVPLQESLHEISQTYESIRTDLDNLTRSFGGGVAAQLDKIHSTLNSQAQSGQTLQRKIDEYADAGEKYATAVEQIAERFAEVEKRLQTVSEIETAAEGLIGRLDAIVSEKRASYNLKELQKSLDSYNKNVESISDFINKDIATVLRQNAEKIESIRKENEQLSQIVSEQGKAVAELTATFAETSQLLKKSVESGSVNQEYLYDAFDAWANDRKVKIKKR